MCLNVVNTLKKHCLFIDYLLFFKQGKGLMQTFWLVEEKKKKDVTQVKSLAKDKLEGKGH